MAEIRKLPIFDDAQMNVQEATLHKGAPLLFNCFTDESGATIKRPGLTQLTDLGTGYPVEGLYWWERKGWLIAVSDGRVWKITASDGTKAELSSGGDKLQTAAQTGGIGKVSFVDDGTYLLMANGGKIVYTNGTAATAYIADADAPTTVYKIAYLDGYLLAAKSGTGQFQWSDNLNSLSWNALSYASAEGLPDELMYLGVGWREILLLGEQSCEVWYNDGQTPFSRLEGAWTEAGCEALNSVIFGGDGNWAFLDKGRRVVYLRGRQTAELSRPIQKYIDSFSASADAVSMVIEVSGRKLLVMTFPTADKTIVLDFAKMDQGQGWTEWAQWNGSVWSRWIGHSHAYGRGWGKNYIGSKSDGKVYSMTVSDVDDAGTAIRALRRTPPIDHGVGLTKRSNWLRVRVRRDLYNANVTDPVLKVRYQDNNSGTWSDWTSLDMGSSGDVEFYVTMRQLGMYRTRQWEFVQDERCGLTLMDAEEEIEVLNR